MNIEMFSRKADLLGPRPVLEQLQEAFMDAGIKWPGTILFDGRIHRFSTDDKQGNTGWFIFFQDHLGTAGQFGDWKQGSSHTWRADSGRIFTPAESFAFQAKMNEIKKLRDAEIEKRHERAAATVAEIWATASPASPEHPYLSRKGVQPHGARIGGDGRLILPLYNAEGSLSSLQYIDAAGSKVYHPGGAVGGCYNVLGSINPQETVYLAEGFATAATVCEVMNATAISAYSANNLPAVAGLLREKFPTLDLVIVADNDKSGTGENYANQAAAKHGARVILIPTEGQDANDFHLSGGDLRGLLTPKNNEYSDKLQIIRSDDIGAEYIPPDEIIQNLFVNRTASVLYGASNSGKTFLSVAMANAVASGSDFLGLHVEKGDVLYIAAESPDSIKTRIQAIKKETGIQPTGIHIAQAPVNIFLHPEYVSYISNAVREIEGASGKKIRMIIFDTLARVSAGANENSGEDMGPIMEAFEAIAKETETAVVAIHHSGKDQTRGSRGWSGIYGAIDAEIEVKEENGARSFRVSKQRRLGSKEQVYGFALKVVEMGKNKWGETATECVIVPAETEQKETLESEKSTILDCCRSLESIDYVDGKPFITTSALSRMLFDLGYAKSESSARQQAKPSARGCLCNKLKTAGIIIHHGSGYIINDDNIISAIELGKKGKT